MSRGAGLGRRAPEQRREAVIDAARALFIEHGRSGTSVDQIARRAGVAKGTVYLYFPSKEHIAQAIESRFDALILRRVRSAVVASVDTGENPVAAWCVALVNASLDELDTHDMLFSGRAATREAEGDDALLDDLTVLLAARADPDPATAAAFLLGGTTLVVDRAILDGRTGDRDGLGRAVGRLVVAVAGRERTV